MSSANVAKAWSISINLDLFFSNISLKDVDCLGFFKNVYWSTRWQFCLTPSILCANITCRIGHSGVNKSDSISFPTASPISSSISV